jgi:hypothetical protein
VSRDGEIEQLKLLIAKLRRTQFGRSSEKLDRQIEQAGVPKCPATHPSRVCSGSPIDS